MYDATMWECFAVGEGVSVQVTISGDGFMTPRADVRGWNGSGRMLTRVIARMARR